MANEFQAGYSQAIADIDALGDDLTAILEWVANNR